jgi:hypothetical protein
VGASECPPGVFGGRPHCDDLAASLGRDGAALPEAAVGMAIDALVAAARSRHGDDAVIRTLSRQERSTAGVFPVL